MIAATFEWIGFHHPTRRRGAIETALTHEVVEPVRTDFRNRERTSTPFSVLVFTAHPHGRGIGHLLDEKCAAGFRGVLTNHVERHPPLHTSASRRVVGKKARRGTNFITPQKRHRPRRIRAATLHQQCDNASGVGLLAEVARVAALLVKSGRANPSRTMTFLWGDEIRSTARFLSDDTTRRAGVKWGMSLDMVGENTAKTGGTFLIEKMPDPSAVWVRGEDQHTEWGGRPLTVAEIRPYWLNDFVRQRCLDRAATTGWVVKANPFEGGSDHTPFLTAKIPAVLLWHFTDQFYHTDLDRIEMVSASTLGNVGNCALTTGLLLTDGSPAVTQAALDELAGVAERELATQAALSFAAIKGGSDATKEQVILDAWRDYYIAALARIPDIAARTAPTDALVSAAQERVRRAAIAALAKLK